MIAAIKRALRKPTAWQAADAELKEAELALLQARSGLEYAQAMVGYHQARVNRLRSFTRSALGSATPADETDF